MITLNSEGRPFSYDFEEAVAAPLVDFDMGLYAGGSRVDCTVARASLTLGSASDSGDSSAGLAVGGAYSASFEAKLTGLGGLPGRLLGRDVEVRVGVMAGGSYEYATVATVTIMQSSTAAGVTTVSGAGPISAKASAPALGLAEGDYTPAQVAAAASAAMGAPVEVGAFASLPSVHVEGGETCRQGLETLALYLGGIAAERGDGSVLVAPLPSAPSCSVDESRLRELPQLSDLQYVVDGVTAVVPAVAGAGEDDEGREEQRFAFGSGRVVFTGAWFTQERAAALWANVAGRSFRPGAVSVSVLDPRLTPFDMASVPHDGEVYGVGAFGVRATYDGGYFGSFESSGPTEVAEFARRAGPMEATLNALVVKSGYIDRLVAQDVTADKVAAGVAAIGELDVGKVEAASAFIGDLEAGGVDASTLTADHAAMGEVEAAAAKVAELSAASAYVKALTGKEVSAEELAAVNATVRDLVSGSVTADAALLAGATIRALLAQSGWFEEATVSGDATITGKLKSVLVDGDTARFQNIYADALKLLGPDGLYHALNFEGLDEAVEDAYREVEPEGDEDPSALGWYVPDGGGGYAASSDAEVVSGRTYYERYERYSDKSTRAFAEAYGEALDGGLHGSHIIAESVTADQIDVSTLVAAMLLAKEVTVGNPYGFHVSISGTELGFYQAAVKAAYVSDNRLMVPRATVLSDMRVGRWAWVSRDSGNFDLCWMG